MSPTKVQPFTQWADISRTNRFLCVEPMSGYGAIIQPEDDGYVIYLAPDASDEAVGRALLECLDKSRFIWPPDPEFSSWQRYMPIHRNWRQDFMRRYGYKTKREAYKNMNWSRAARCEGKISIRPHKRDTPVYWHDLPPEMTVVIAATMDAIVAGAALRLALDRCESRQVSRGSKGIRTCSGKAPGPGGT